ncbi:MAG: dihydroxy-acid dehydratase [Planctomycetaceae bacterium]|nr:dihydroxy-acid dehydratase [Planctomycetaceae bacterium]
MTLRSQTNLSGQENGLARSLYKSMGYSDDELDGRPVIGIANSWSTLVPGHYNLNELAKFVVKGIYRAGGTAAEFGVISACDGIANGHVGMKYILPSREVICNSVEIEAEAHRLDGLVLLASCDKILPGMLMAAARLDIPAIVVNGGVMQGGAVFDGRKTDATSNDEAVGMLKAGKIGAEKLRRLEDVSCPGCGSCSFLGTANTMGCVSEALGMSLPGSALTPAVWADRQRIAYESGRRVCELIGQGITARQIISEKAIRNAARVVQAISGSTNAVLHLSAIAYEAGLDLDAVDVFGRMYADTPHLVKVNPSSSYDMEDFHRAGGIPKVMRNLGELIDGAALTCTGRTVAENLASYSDRSDGNPEVIKDIAHAYSRNGGIAVLRGSLAPDTAVTKPGAYAEALRHFKGKARVFDREEAANEAILAGEIQPGDVVVIRYEGPKGGPGMREMYKALKFLYGRGLAETTALVTDGRFSGTNNGCFAGHISPEAAEGGPIALVRDGDIIEIDVNNGRLDLLVEADELARRQAAWVPPAGGKYRGYLGCYAKLASSASKGAVIVND